MNEENNHDPSIHTLATDKIQSKLINIMFSIEDVRKALKLKMYGGITEEEQILILETEKKEKRIYEYILDALDTFTDKTR
jgi:septum formation inhibitor-activating ATPase MinD